MSEEKENNTNTKKKNLYSCLKPYKSLFLSKNQKLNQIGYSVFIALFFVIFSFQNCKEGNIDNGNNVESSETPDTTQPITPTDPTFEPVKPNSPPLGSLIAYLSDDTEKTPQDEFDSQQQVILEFIEFHRSSNSFQWTISRGFETITEPQVTTQSNYETSFSQKGAYDAFSTSHIAGDPKILSRASKRLTIGEECDPSEILEIKVGSGSLVKGGTVTLELENSQLFNNVSWKIQQDSQSLLAETQQTATVSLPEQGGSSLIVEVTAVSNDSTRDQCMIYRKKELQVNENAKPHFNIVRPVDDTHPVTLENNEVYKYKRTSQSKYIEILITGASECRWDGNVIACNNGQWDITREDLVISECSQAVNTLDVSYLDGNNDSQEEQRSYYKFCPQDQDICYFGPLNARPVHHDCGNSRTIQTVTTTTTTTPTTTTATTATTATTTTTTTTPQSACSSVQKAPGYRDVNGQCLKSCQTAGGTHTGSDCDPGEGYDLVLIVGTYEDPCCRQIPRQAVNGQCNNNNQNTCLAGTPTPQASSGGFYRWHCNGSSGGTNAANCQKAQPNNRINGVCNNNLINGCSPGNAVAKTPSGGFYRWDCQGINAGTIATGCQKAISVSGICSTSNHFECTSGRADNKIELTEAYTWHCVGSNGGVTAGNCRKSKPINGQCNNDTKNACLAGTSVPQTASGGFDKWHCNGSNTGANATNCQKAQAVNGQCDSTQKDGCLTGQSDPQAESNGFYNWYCRGEHDGSDATCKLSAGSRCNYPDTIADYINSCKSGTTSSDRIDDNNYYRWACGDEECQRLKPFHGECSPTQKGQCARGIAGTVEKQVESYVNSGYYILPEVPNPKATSKAINENEKYDLSTLDEIWSCEGGASKVYCRQTQTFDGECPTDPPTYNAKNDFINYCKQGYVANIRGDDTDEYTWSCYYSYGGRIRDACTRQKLGAPPASQIKSQGECSATRRQCRGGTVGNYKTKRIATKYNNGGRISDRTLTLYTWECVGSGSSATTQKCKDVSSVFVGECDNTEVDQCAGGILYDLDDSDTHYRWLCFGSTPKSDQRNKGNIAYCSKPKFQVIEDSSGVQVIRPF